MVQNSLALVLGLLTLAIPCLRAAPHHSPPDDHGHHHSFVPFDEFIDQVKHAQFKDYEHTRVKCQEDFEDMKGHILHMYDGVGDVKSWVLEREYGDCIAKNKQPTVRDFGIDKIAEHPENSTFPEKPEGEVGCFEYAESPLKLGLTDRFGNPICCPEHTIPMARLTLEKLTRYQTLLDFFAKSPVPGESERSLKRQEGGSDILPEEGEAHLHAIGLQYVDNYGGNSWLNLWNPKGDFSLSQQWYIGGSGNDTQTVEGGWQVYPGKYNTDNAVLFIYFTADKYISTGCYNLDCTAFVQTNHNWFLGAIWDHYSTTGGTQWGFEMQWKLYQGNWWLFLKGPGSYEAVGYYPTSIFKGGQLSKHAERSDFGGEVTRVDPSHRWPQMGSGAFASEGFGKAAFQNTIFYIPHDQNDGYGVWSNLTKIVEGQSSCWTLDLHNAPTGGDWGTYFYYGGPGGDKCN